MYKYTLGGKGGWADADPTPGGCDNPKGTTCGGVACVSPPFSGFLRGRAYLGREAPVVLPGSDAAEFAFSFQSVLRSARRGRMFSPEPLPPGPFQVAASLT